MALTSSQNPKRITEITSTSTASEPIRSCGAIERLALIRGHKRTYYLNTGYKRKSPSCTIQLCF